MIMLLSKIIIKLTNVDNLKQWIQYNPHLLHPIDKNFGYKLNINKPHWFDDALGHKFNDISALIFIGDSKENIFIKMWNGRNYISVWFIFYILSDKYHYLQIFIIWFKFKWSWK